MIATQIAGYTALGIVALCAATMVLPRHIKVERTAEMRATPEAVLSLAASNAGSQTFNPYKT
ncbi:MAG: hypothetical protein AAFY03_00005, partial [Pseudomonadota bacterium]